MSKPSSPTVASPNFSLAHVCPRPPSCRAAGSVAAAVTTDSGENAGKSVLKVSITTRL
ncbi:hypothetical protein Hte_012494 [Hypoxylon texense]